MENSILNFEDTLEFDFEGDDELDPTITNGIALIVYKDNNVSDFITGIPNILKYIKELQQNEENTATNKNNRRGITSS